MTRRRALLSSIGGALLAPALATAAFAQDPPADAAAGKEFVPELKDATGRKDGIDSTLSAGLTASLADNRSVVGQLEGSTMSFGLKFDAAVNVNKRAHEWRSTLRLNQSLTKTPLVEEIVKGVDTAALESIYLYHATPAFGPFARFAAETALFRGADVRPAPVTYMIARLDGSTDARTQRSLTLTDPLTPTTLKESAGPFLRAVDSERLNVETRAGAGARQTFADGQLALNDNADTPEVEVQELRDNAQLGVEATLAIWGALSEKKVTYRAGVDVLIPFLYTELPPGDNRSTGDLIAVEAGGALSFKLVEWASLDYELKLKREPLLIDTLQVQNSLLLTLGLATGTGAK